MPLYISVLYIFSAAFYSDFRFKDLSTSYFTLFYFMVGADSLYDAAIGTF
jgi:hypothetical protein